MDLTERKRKILNTIITDYIERAEPVGSRTLTKRYEFDISPATIRNEMADLEEMGYLKQPHTSAGRIPSQKGYRFFVDHLISSGLLTSKTKILQKKLKSRKVLDLNEIIQETARSLAEITEYTSLVLGPRPSRSSFQEIRLFPIGNQQVLLVLTTESGIVESKPVKVSSDLTIPDMEKISEYLNQKLAGLTIDDITPSLMRELRTDLIKETDVVEHTLYVLAESFKQSGEKLALGGTTNILKQPEFNDLHKVRELLSFFENENSLMELLTDAEGIVVRIGRENPREEIQDCSVITASYELKGRPLGTIGVLGPTRMDYSRVIAIVDQIAKELTKTLESQGKISSE